MALGLDLLSERPLNRKAQGTWHLSGHVCILSLFSRVQFFATPWTKPARLLCPWDSPGPNTGVGGRARPPGDLPAPGIEPMSLAPPALGGGSLTTHATWEALGAQASSFSL